MESAPSTGVGKTALAIALVRAQETERPDRIFDDPWAEAFLAAAPEVFAEELRAARTGTVSEWGLAYRASVLLRTRFFDDYLLTATRDARLQQVVLLGAGLDARAYRLDWPVGTTVFELDLPPVLAFKESVLAGRGATPRCDRRPVAADVTGDWPAALAAAGFRADAPTAWLAEGLLIYLSAGQVAGLLGALHELSAAGSQLAFGYEKLSEPDRRTALDSIPALAEYTPLWQGGLPSMDGWLRDRGWSLAAEDRAVLAERYGRPELGRQAGGFLVATAPAS